MLSRHTHAPTVHDTKEMDRVLQYIASTPDLGLTFSSTEGVKLYANHTDRKSHSECTLHIGRTSGAFLSRSKKQTVTADSSPVAEIIAAHLATKEIMCGLVHYLLKWDTHKLIQRYYLKTICQLFILLITTAIVKRQNTSTFDTI